MAFRCQVLANKQNELKIEQTIINDYFQNIVEVKLIEMLFY
jgi:hypothetical protein